MTSAKRAAPYSVPGQERAALRSAIIDRDTAKERLRRIEQAERRGREMLQTSEATLAGFGDLDALILQLRADKIKCAADGGPSPDLSVPKELVTRRAKRDEVREHVEAAKVALSVVSAERAEAGKVLDKAEQKVVVAAVDTLQTAAAKHAKALRSALDEIWAQYDALTALAHFWVPGADGARPITLPAETARLLQRVAASDHRQFPGGRNVAAATLHEHWRRWFEALLSDAKAAFEHGGTAKQKVA